MEGLSAKTETHAITDIFASMLNCCINSVRFSTRKTLTAFPLAWGGTRCLPRPPLTTSKRDSRKTTQTRKLFNCSQGRIQIESLSR